MQTNNDIGFIVPNNKIYLTLSQLFVDLTKDKIDSQYTCFAYNNEIIINQLHMPILPITEAKFWNGKIFVFNLEAIDIVKNFTNLTDIYYYMDRDEWSEYAYANYFDLKAVYEENNKIKIVVSNNDLYNKYQKCWNKNPIGIMETLSYENFKNTIFTTE